MNLTKSEYNELINCPLKNIKIDANHFCFTINGMIDDKYYVKLGDEWEQNCGLEYSSRTLNTIDFFDCSNIIIYKLNKNKKNKEIVYKKIICSELDLDVDDYTYIDDNNLFSNTQATKKNSYEEISEKEFKKNIKKNY
jgi:hypothetical protein